MEKTEKIVLRVYADLVFNIWVYIWMLQQHYARLELPIVRGRMQRRFSALFKGTKTKQIRDYSLHS